ncbi:HAD family hydrolase [Vibrio chagasii]|nr:HAD family hydrolase [Vibrio chagasii]CAH7138645.1 HAD family hydrolase [Vibrio chagasii]CAH7199390.1 HAD family hydrolase [Vibrio chagasii]CAH7292519.1 HAD family hydrolase [Vibrio chagasii]
MYQVLALDLDGTVLTDDHTIHPEVKKAIQEAKQHCHVMIVTGRHHTAARPYYYELGLDTPIICCNGTYVYDYQTETVLTQNAIEHEHALTFIDLAQEHKLKMVMYITDAMTYSNYNPFAYMLALEEWAEQAPWVKDHFNGERSWSNRIDFAAKGNSKGLRLAEYVNELGFKPSQVIAVGDNHNDISMLQYAGLGVAMFNADDTVKSNAQVVCKTDNNQDGLAHLIREQIKG